MNLARSVCKVPVRRRKPWSFFTLRATLTCYWFSAGEIGECCSQKDLWIIGRGDWSCKWHSVPSPKGSEEVKKLDLWVLCDLMKKKWRNVWRYATFNWSSFLRTMKSKFCTTTTWKHLRRSVTKTNLKNSIQGLPVSQRRLCSLSGGPYGTYPLQLFKSCSIIIL